MRRTLNILKNKFKYHRLQEYNGTMPVTITVPLENTVTTTQQYTLPEIVSALPAQCSNEVAAKPSPLEEVPAEIVTYQIMSFLGKKEFSNLTETSKTINGFFSIERNKIILLLYVLQGNLREAKKLIELNPNQIFLIPPYPVKDYSGRVIQCTPYQAALNTDDEKMLHMMEEYFEIIPNAWKTAQDQFPQWKEPIIYNLDNLVVVLSSRACKWGKMTSALQFELNSLENYFNSNNPTSSEKHFAVQNLINAYLKYTEKYDDWDGDQCHLFFMKVIGFLQRFLPASYARDICKAIRETHNKTPEADDFCSFTLPNGKLFPRDNRTPDQLGRQHAININGLTWSATYPNSLGLDILLSLHHSKQKALEEFKQQLINKNDKTSMENQKFSPM